MLLSVDNDMIGDTG